MTSTDPATWQGNRLRDYARRENLRVRQIPGLLGYWSVYLLRKRTSPHDSTRVAWGSYHELLKFFDGVAFGRKGGAA